MILYIFIIFKHFNKFFQRVASLLKIQFHSSYNSLRHFILFTFSVYNEFGLFAKTQNLYT